MAVASYSKSRPTTHRYQQPHLFSQSYYNSDSQNQQAQPQQQPELVFSSVPDHSGPPQSWSQPQSLSIPRSAQTHGFAFSSPINDSVDDVPLPDQVPELMNDHHHWQASQAQHHQQQQQQQEFSTPRGLNALPAHQRNTSLSTLGSAGPSSPYAQPTANPRIAVNDSSTDGISDMGFHDAAAVMYGSGKQNVHQESFYSQYPASLSHSRRQPAAHSSQRSESTLLPPPEFQFSASPNPVSVASSNASDSPATPCMEHHQQQPVSRGQNQQQSFNPSVPKLDRTMTDVYADELYNPNFEITNTVQPSTPSSAVSPNSDLFSQRIHAANSQHLSAANSPATTISRERSPFRNNSPFAQLSQNLNNINTQTVPAASNRDMRFSSAQQLGDSIKIERDTATMIRHHQISSRQAEAESVKTISPKDAMLEFTESSDAGQFPLFPQHDNSNHFLNLGDTSGVHTTQGFASIPVTTAHDSSFANFIPSSMADQYTFLSRGHDGSEMHQLPTDVNHQMQHQHQQQSQQQNRTPISPQNPTSSTVDRGTFSCTYQGCPMRFETATLLQKHKREGHRQAHGLSTGRREVSMVSGGASTQNGPHKCMQINPSTGKACNTEFSRPYDLTRHEDTIHNPKKRKVTCPACTDKKQFSRGDALSRHYRVCHPELSPPGKRRGGAGRV